MESAGPQRPPEVVRVTVVWSRAPDFDDLFALRQLNPGLARQPVEALRERIAATRQIVLGDFPRSKAEEVARRHKEWGLEVVCAPPRQ
jgi:hypothetical protein